MSSFASLRASVGPTPWSVSTGASIRTGRGALGGAGQRSGASRPAKPTGRRTAVLVPATARTTIGPGPAWTATRRESGVVLEPEEADGARARVRADDGAEGRRELDLGLRAHAPNELAEDADPLRRVCVRDRDPKPRLVLRRLLEAPLELDERLLPPADAGDGDDLAVLDREDRADVQERPRERGRTADAPTPLQELERLEREDDAAVTVEALDERFDLLVGRAAGETSLDCVREHRERERRAPRVDDADLVASDFRRSDVGALERPRQLRGEVQRVDPLVRRKLLV